MRRSETWGTEMRRRGRRLWLKERKVGKKRGDMTREMEGMNGMQCRENTTLGATEGIVMRRGSLTRQDRVMVVMLWRRVSIPRNARCRCRSWRTGTTRTPAMTGMKAPLAVSSWTSSRETQKIQSLASPCQGSLPEICRRCCP